MTIQRLPQPPRKDDPRFNDWMNQLWRKVVSGDAFHDAQAITVAASSAINTTETIIVGGLGKSRFPANTLQAGSTIRIRINGTCTASAANVSTFRVRFGTAGTTADTAIGTAATAVSATSGTAIPFSVEITFTVRTVGATGSIAGTLTLLNSGTTGISTTLVQTIALSVAAINTTVDSYLSLTYVAAATTTTSTFQNGIIEVVKQ